MNKNKKRLLVTLGLISSITTLLLLYSAYTISKFVARTTFTQPKQEEMEHARHTLMTTFKAKSVTLKTDDGIDLAGLWIKRPHARYTFLLCHGFRTSKDKWIEFVSSRPHDNILALDLRAHGQSSGKLISFGWHETRDIKAAVNWLSSQPKIAKTNIIGVGSSMGSVALLLAAQQETTIDGIVALSPFATLEKLIEKNFYKVCHLPKFPLFKIQRWLLRRKLGVDLAAIAPIHLMAQLTMPIFILHADHDPLTPVEHAHALAEQTTSKHDIWIINGTQHGRALISADIEEFKKRFSTWLKNNFGHA